jgi:hypothetical protein
VLEDPQQLRLRLQRQLTDFVQKDRPAVGELETPGLRGAGIREGALLPAEQLALDERGRQGRAIHADERRSATAAGVMQQAGGDALARAGLAEQEHGGRGRRHLLQPLAQRAKRLTVADEIGRLVELWRSKDHRIRGNVFEFHGNLVR